jgi:hypothetical protein
MGEKENLIGKQTNHHDHDHNADHLFHRLLLASKMQKLAEPKPVRIVTKISAAMRERQANAQPCFIPLTINGNAASRITLNHICKRFEPIVSAARQKDRRDVSHAGIRGNDHRPQRAHNHDKQHGGFGLTEPKQRERTQQTLGSVCNPRAVVPIVSRNKFQRAVNKPNGKPPTMPTT